MSFLDRLRKLHQATAPRALTCLLFVPQKDSCTRTKVEEILQNRSTFVFILTDKNVASAVFGRLWSTKSIILEMFKNVRKFSKLTLNFI